MSSAGTNARESGSGAGDAGKGGDWRPCAGQSNHIERRVYNKAIQVMGLFFGPPRLDLLAQRVEHCGVSRTKLPGDGRHPLARSVDARPAHTKEFAGVVDGSFYGEAFQLEQHAIHDRFHDDGYSRLPTLPRPFPAHNRKKNLGQPWRQLDLLIQRHQQDIFQRTPVALLGLLGQEIDQWALSSSSHGGPMQTRTCSRCAVLIFGHQSALENRDHGCL
jgi:hypothetical protein